MTTGSARAQIVHDSDLNAYNSFDHPDRVAIKAHEASASGDTLKVTLPALSVVTVIAQVG